MSKYYIEESETVKGMSDYFGFGRRQDRDKIIVFQALDDKMAEAYMDFTIIQEIATPEEMKAIKEGKIRKGRKKVMFTDNPASKSNETMEARGIDKQEINNFIDKYIGLEYQWDDDDHFTIFEINLREFNLLLAFLRSRQS